MIMKWRIVVLTLLVSIIVAVPGVSTAAPSKCSSVWKLVSSSQCTEEKTTYTDSEVLTIIEEGSNSVAHVPKTDSWWSKVMSAFRPPSLVRIFSWDAIKDVIKAFHNLVALILGAFADFWKWTSDLFKSNAQLAVEAKQLYDDLDADVSLLVKKHKSLSQMCQHPADNEAWTECNKAMIQSTDAVVEVVRDRRKARRIHEGLRIRVTSGDW
jgi:hypothetical protein